MASTIVVEQELPGDEPPILAAVPEIPRPESADPQPASDLALDLVLNEIVLQARLTTNATGAVFALACSGELISRATTGATASDVAICLRTRSGIAATCFETSAVRRIDDLGLDNNADAVAYRRSGVRSILVVPVQGEKGPLLGVLEIFSPRPNAFCDGDVLTLQALARRIATNIELVQQNYGVQGNLPHRRPRVPASLAEQPSNNGSLQQSRRARSGLQVPQFVSAILAQRARLASVDWISVLAKSAIALVLVAGSIIVRSCWQRGGEAGLVQAIRNPTWQTSRVPAQHSVDPIAPSAAPFKSIKAPSVDPWAWPPKVSSHPEATASITIQRHPIRKAELLQPEKPNKPAPSDNRLVENHKPGSGSRTTHESKSSSKDPAAAVLPNETAGSGSGNSKIEAISTQAAMARLIQRIEPEYPNAARKQHIQGTVLLDVIVNPSGAVDGLSLVSGESQLMVAAAEAVKQWHFQPLIKDGQATQFESRISIDFTLAGEAPSTSH
jgi:TonB family protein